MNAQMGECTYETKGSVTRKLRLFYWIVVTTGPTLFFILFVGDLRVAALMFAAAWGVMLLNGYRTVIGVRVCRDRLRITTALAVHEFPWSRVAIKKYPAIFARTDIYVKGKVWPFMMGLGMRGTREAIDAMENARSSQP
ncbi:MAG: hypothetical protein NTU88_11660 [Armatimonadetes bacterium]|nr:hypothetical protein [Armatimonadota bacterium]